MTITVRFAPSPTGDIHLGNARTALYNALFAAKGGRFILRFDDTDLSRSEDRYVRRILDDLRWLGIDPDDIVRQSERVARYDEAATRLRREGLLYPCYETTEELDRIRARRRARGLPPIYDRRALSLTADAKATLEAEGRRPHWRFLLPNHDGDPLQILRREAKWSDLFRGEETVDLGSLSDPVLVREDGTYLYTLPSVVDDLEFAVTHVIRGNDHLTNTGVQLALFRALGGAAPIFGHHNLLQTAQGEGLSKRLGSLSLRRLREEGYEAMAVASYASLIGTSDAPRPMRSLAEVAQGFDPKRVSRGAARMEPVELRSLNARTLHAMRYDDVRERLAEIGVGGGEALWNAVKGNLDRFDDVSYWWRVVDGAIDAASFSPEDEAFVREAAEHLPPEPWDETSWSEWTTSLKKATGRKGKSLFMPLRLALTGRSSGPELAALLPLIGRSSALARLCAHASHPA